MMKYLILCIALLVNSRAFAQQKDYGKVWVDGISSPIYKTSFGTGTVVTAKMAILPDTLIFVGGQSVISDSLGNLLLMSNGLSLYNALGDTIDGGYKLAPDMWFYFGYNGNPYAQASIILPAENGKYHFVNANPTDSVVTNAVNHVPNFDFIFDELWYSQVDMKANNGAGKVIKRKIPLVTNVKMALTEMTACRHGDGKSWWLTKQAHDTNLIYKFLLTQNNVYGPYLQGFSQPKFGRFDNGGQSVFSKDGTRYATVARDGKVLFVADFNRCTGMFSNPLVYNVPKPTLTYDNGFSFQDPTTEGVAFSANGRFVYVSKYYAVMQLDLQDGNPSSQWDTTARIDTTWAQFTEYASIYLGPDDKIYLGNWNGTSCQMSVINNPDNKGAACNFCPRCLRFPCDPLLGGNVGSPPNITNYKLGAANPICWATPVEEVDKPVVLKVHPNPTSGWVTIDYDAGNTEDLTLQITDVFGRLVYETELDIRNTQQRFSLSSQPSGVYFYNVLTNGAPHSSGKIVLTH